MNVVREIRKQDHGKVVAIRESGREISFDELFTAVGEITHWLKKELSTLRSEAIPRIGVRAPNSSAYIAVSLAVLEAGACFVPIPDELTESEQQRLISDTALHAAVIYGDSGFELPLGFGKIRLQKFPNQVAGFPVDEFEALNPAFIRFSSGTTAQSKGVVISHESLKERILAANQGLQLQSGDRVLWTLPMAHHFAVTIVLYLYQGVTTVLETTHRPDQLYKAAAESSTQLLYGSPFHFAQLAQCKEAGLLPDLRMVISTASALTQEIADSFLARFEIPITQALGIIEVGLPILNGEDNRKSPTALGKPLPDYEIKIAPDGELQIKGAGMFDAYLLPWKKRADLLQEGFFATGDIVSQTENGTITLEGRKKSVINVGGMKVFPEEIEAVLNDHPHILHSKVTATEHPTLGAFPSASIILRENCRLPKPIELRKFCAERLTSYKVPLSFKKVEAIQKTASGKIKRHSSIEK